MNQFSREDMIAALSSNGSRACAEMVLDLRAKVQELNDLLAITRMEREDAKAVCCVCVNLFKALQMAGEGKIDDLTLNEIVLNSEKDIQHAAEWLNAYVGSSLNRIAELERQVEHLRGVSR